jgi:hypothetical protein
MFCDDRLSCFDENACYFEIKPGANPTTSEFITTYVQSQCCGRLDRFFKLQEKKLF